MEGKKITKPYPTELREHAIKIVESDHESPNAADMFRAATTGGARALGRDDLGRIAPGMKADVIVVDFDNLVIGPVVDPIRALVYSATSDMVEHVFVDGRPVVTDRRLLCWDQQDALEGAWRSAERVWGEFGSYHWAGNTVDEVFPSSFKSWMAPDGL